MSKSRNNFMVFQDSEGMLCGVRKDFTDYDGAYEIARQQLVESNTYGDFTDVKPCYDYNYMYHGFGKSDSESDNTWWLCDTKVRSGTEVYVFRAVQS